MQWLEIQRPARGSVQALQNDSSLIDSAVSALHNVPRVPRRSAYSRRSHEYAASQHPEALEYQNLFHSPNPKITQ